MPDLTIPSLAIGQEYGPITIDIINSGSVLPNTGDVFTVTSGNTDIAVPSTIATVMGTIQFDIMAVGVGQTVLTVVDSAGSIPQRVTVTVEQMINLGAVDATISWCT